MNELSRVLGSSVCSTAEGSIPHTGHFIAGKWWRKPTSGNSEHHIESYDPATGNLIARIAAGTSVDIDAAVTAARDALTDDTWAKSTPEQRATWLNNLADLIERDTHDIAYVESRENGMPLNLASAFGVGGAVRALRYYAGWATKISGKTMTPSIPGDWHVFSTRQPVGVVGLIIPWNMPFAMAVGKLAPALAAGCTVVLKPSELTSLSALKLAQITQAAGIPPGVVNIVTGTGLQAGAALVEHPGIDKVSFTGSVSTGQSILAMARHNLKRITLELGGKSPVFIFADSDLDAAIAATASGIFTNAGQVCTAGSRLYVDERVYEEVVEGLVARAEHLTLGPGQEPSTDMGPLISAQHRQGVQAKIESSVEQGAHVVAGGSQVEGPGFFMQPTVLTHVRAGMPVVDEEVFGPVLAVQLFNETRGSLAERDEQIIQLANSTPYGLAASLWTSNVGRALRIASRIRAGTVKINSPVGVDPAVPFGGFGLSGWGRENGWAGIEAYTELQSTFVSL